MKAYIRKSVQRMTGYIPGEQPEYPSVIKLNTNENPYPPSPRVREVLDHATLDGLRAYPDPVCRKLREKIAYIHGCVPDQIIVGNGSDELLSLCVRAFVEREGTVGYLSPSYSLYPVLSQIEDVRTRPVQLGPEFSWRMPGEYEASLFFLTNPHAPTGILYPKETVKTFCAHFSGVVVIDEAYVDFAPEHALDLALHLGHVLVTRSLSKAYSLAGIRLGYLIGPLPLVQALYKIKDSYNVNRLSQEIGLAALSDRDYMRAQVARIRATREEVAAALRHKGYKVFPSETNFLWVRPRDISAQKLFEELKNKRILVRHFSGENIEDYLRISVGTPAAMNALVEAL